MFWAPYRSSGYLYQGKVGDVAIVRPSEIEYGQALFKALRDAGYDRRAAAWLAREAQAARAAAGLSGDVPVPNVPGRLPQARQPTTPILLGP